MTTVAFAAFIVAAVTAVGSTRTAEADWRSESSAAFRSAASGVIDSVVVIEPIAASESSGEVSLDAPTSGIYLGDGRVLCSRLPVSSDAAGLVVLAGDGSRSGGEVVAVDHHRELALLKVDFDSPPPALEWDGDAELPPPGTSIAVLGRYGSTAAPLMARGAVSADGRLEGTAFQVDARIGPPFYGGVVVDRDGRPLGMVIPAVGRGGAENPTDWYDSGIAFAIETATISRKLPRLMAGEDIHPGLLGLATASKDPQAINTVVSAVRPRSPAEAAGIRVGDRLRSVGGRGVDRFAAIRQALGPRDAGDTVTVVLDRDGSMVTTEVTLAKTIPPLKPQAIGVVVASDDGGLKVVAKHDAADAGALRVGDVIERVDDQAATVEGLTSRLAAAEPRTPLTFEAKRDAESFDGTLTTRDRASLEGIRWPAELSDRRDWKLAPLVLPEVSCPAKLLGPSDPPKPPADADARPALLVVLCEASGDAIDAVIDGVRDDAEGANVALLVIAPEEGGRWRLADIDAVTRLTVAAKKRCGVDPLAVGLTAEDFGESEKATGAAALSLAIAVTQSETFRGLIVSPATRPPARRLPENQVTSPVCVACPFDADDPPTFVEQLVAGGYAVRRSVGDGRSDYLRWVRWLSAL